MGNNCNCVSNKTQVSLSLKNGHYTGDASNQTPYGEGIMHYINGDKYNGEWRYGQKWGRGKKIS